MLETRSTTTMLSRRRFAIRAVLVLVLVSCVRPDENAKIDNHDVVAFTISKEQEGQQKVSATLSTGEHVTCEFDYKTSTKEKQIETKPVEKEAEPPQPKVTAASVMESLNGRCTSTDRGFWTYEVCIGKSITQKHQQERYVMGRTVVPSSDPSSKFQKYVGGEVCSAVTGEPKRETTVSMSKRTRMIKIFTNNLRSAPKRSRTLAVIFSG